MKFQATQFSKLRYSACMLLENLSIVIINSVCKYEKWLDAVAHWKHICCKTGR